METYPVQFFLYISVVNQNTASGKVTPTSAVKGSVSGQGQSPTPVGNGSIKPNLVTSTSSVDNAASARVQDQGQDSHIEGTGQSVQVEVNSVRDEAADPKYVPLTEPQLNVILCQFGEESLAEARQDCEYGHMLLAEYAKYLEDFKSSKTK